MIRQLAQRAGEKPQTSLSLFLDVKELEVEHGLPHCLLDPCLLEQQMERRHVFWRARTRSFRRGRFQEVESTRWYCAARTARPEHEVAKTVHADPSKRKREIVGTCPDDVEKTLPKYVESHHWKHWAVQKNVLEGDTLFASTEVYSKRKCPGSVDKTTRCMRQIMVASGAPTQEKNCTVWSGPKTTSVRSATIRSFSSGRCRSECTAAR